jgi:hypothetical protein
VPESPDLDEGRGGGPLQRVETFREMLAALDFRATFEQLGTS